MVGDNKRKYIFWNCVRFITFFYVVIPPLVLGLTVDFFTNYQRGDSLGRFYAYAIFLGASSAVFLFVRANTKRRLVYIRNATYYNIRVKGFDKLISLPLRRHKKENAGAKAQKIQNGMASFRSFVAVFENKIFSSVATFAGTLIVFIFLSPIYIIFFVAYYVLFFLLLKVYYKKILLLNYRHNISKEDASGAYIEGLNNILSIKSSGAEPPFKDYISSKEAATRRIGDRESKTIITQWTYFHILNSVSSGLFLFFIGRGVIMESITIGSIVILFSYLERLITSSSNIISVYQEFIESKNGIARMMPIFWDNHKSRRGDEKFPLSWDLIEMKNVNFIYKKEEKDEFHTGVYGVNFKIKKNNKIGFAGKTGSGKSTLAKLLIGLYPIDSGEYLIGNRNVYDIENENLLDNISIVLQESEMFNFSLKDNITLMHNYDPELFKKAVKISQLDEVIKKLPKGIDNLIGEKGYHLSGGERQRVGIARAVYRDTQIMIFDEATSSLDNKTESLIQEALENEMEKKTLIFIAHRITTLKNVDTIYVFKNGKIIENGIYRDLLNNPKTEFHKLFNSKLGGKDKILKKFA